MKSNNALLLILVLILSACQEATQPTDLRSSRTMTVSISANNAPLAGATVLWNKITGLNAPMSGVGQTATDGFARLIIPDVSTQRDSIELVMRPPARDPFIGVEPAIVGMSICNDTALNFSFAETVFSCGTTSVNDTIRLHACPSEGQSVVSTCRFYSTMCPPGLQFTSSTANTPEITVSTTSLNGNTSSVQVCVTFTPEQGKTGGTQNFTTSITGVDPNGGSVQFQMNLVVESSVDCMPCPCPDIQKVSYRTSPVCVGQKVYIQIPIDTLTPPVPLGVDCMLQLELESPMNDVEFEVISGESMSVRGGSWIPAISIAVAPTNPGELKRTIRWKLSTMRISNGVETNCTQTFEAEITIPVFAPDCRVEHSLGQLRKCVFSDSSTTDTLYLINDGDCDAIFNVETDRQVFTVTPGGTVVVPAKSRVPVVVRMIVTKPDWDRNPAPPQGNRGDKPFSANIIIGGCVSSSIPVNGIAYVLCSAFKYQCLRQFRPPSYPDVYAESIELVENKTNIVYQNDNQTFKTYDVYVSNISGTPGNYSIELSSGSPGGGTPYGRFMLVANNFFVQPGQSVCDTYPSTARSMCETLKLNPGSSAPVLGGLTTGDVVLFVKDGSTGPQCALIWIQNIGPDRVGASSLPAACIEICYPVFAF